MKTYSWVYRNRVTDDLVLVMKPHRRAVNGTYRLIAGVFKRNGFRPDSFITSSVRSYDRSEFRTKFQYVGGLNTGLPVKSKVDYFHKVNYGDKTVSYSFIVPFKGPNAKMMHKHHFDRMLESVKLEGVKLGLQLYLHCIEIDSCKTSKFIPAGSKKYRYDFVGLHQIDRTKAEQAVKTYLDTYPQLKDLMNRT